MPIMEFFRCYCVALLWEYLELLSLLLSHYILDLWLHIHVSLSSNTLMSKLIYLTRSLPLSMASFSAILRALFFSSKSLQTFPNFFLLHHFATIFHFHQNINACFRLNWCQPRCLYSFSIATIWQPRILKLEHSLTWWTFKPEKIKEKRGVVEWVAKEATRVPRNLKSQLLVAKPLSSLFQIECPS